MWWLFGTAVYVDLDVNQESVVAVDVQKGETEGSVYEVSVALVQEINCRSQS